METTSETLAVAGGLTFSGRNPGDLGEDIRNMTLPPGTVRSQRQSHAPNKSGTCP